MIVVTAPTGRIGRLLLDLLLDAGEDVRVIVRDPARLPETVRGRVETVRGSHADAEVVARAFAGADRVFWLVPPDFSAADVRRYYADFTAAACDAIERRGVERVVAVSSLGRGFPGPTGHLAAAHAMEGMLESTGARFRALQMPFFMENLLGQTASIGAGEFRLTSGADRTLALCAVRDIAAAAAGLLLDGTWDGQDGVPVLAPGDLTPVDMARTMAEVLGRPVRYRETGLAEYRAALLRNGAAEGTAQAVIDMADAQNRGIYDVGPEVKRSPTSFRRWCEDVLRPAVLA